MQQDYFVGTARALAQLIDHKTDVNSKLTHYLAFNLW
jgi:hypothetical protein